MAKKKTPSPCKATVPQPQAGYPPRPPYKIPFSTPADVFCAAYNSHLFAAKWCDKPHGRDMAWFTFWWAHLELLLRKLLEEKPIGDFPTDMQTILKDLAGEQCRCDGKRATGLESVVAGSQVGLLGERGLEQLLWLDKDADLSNRFPGIKVTPPVANENKSEGTGGAGTDDEIGALEKNTPPLDRHSTKWVSNKRAAGIDGVETRTLADYRLQGVKNAAGSLGRDKDGRVWRREGTPHSHPWYLRSTLSAK